MAENIQFLNNMYFRGGYDENNKWQNDFMYIIYKNTDTGEKKVKRLEEPSITFYQSKKKLNHPYPTLPKDMVIERKCKFRNLIPYMAKLLGPKAQAQVEALKKDKKFSLLNEIHHNVNFFSSDIDIEDYWKSKFLAQHESSSLHLKKAFYDIEVDTQGFSGFPSEVDALCPINAVTLVDADSKNVFTFLLTNDNNPLIKKTMDDIEGFKERIHEKFDESYPGMEYNIMFYDDELALIKEFFRVINDLEPDFAAGRMI